MCLQIIDVGRIKQREMHGGGILDLGMYPIQLACLVYDQMPENIVALGNILESGTNMSRLMGKPTMWFSNRSDTNWDVQPQKKSRSLKFRI